MSAEEETKTIPDGGGQDPKKIAEYYAALDALRIELKTTDGRVFATETIHITDFSAEFGDDSLEVEIIFAAREFFQG